MSTGTAAWELYKTPLGQRVWLFFRILLLSCSKRDSDEPSSGQAAVPVALRSAIRWSAELYQWNLGPR